MRTSGLRPSPSALPFSTSHPDGMSTETMGIPAPDMRDKAESNGERTGGLKENPKIASRITSVDDNAERRDSVSLEGARVSIFMLSH